MLRNNPTYSKIFASVDVKTTEQLVDSFTLLQIMPISRERSISMAVICEVLEEREYDVNTLID